MRHRLMVGTWTPPGRIYTVEFDDEALTLTLVKKTAIPEDEPISWLTFDVSLPRCFATPDLTKPVASTPRKIYTALR